MAGTDTWTSWVVAILGLWILVSPFVMSGDIGTGAVMWSNVLSGAIVLILGGWEAYEAQQAGA